MRKLFAALFVILLAGAPLLGVTGSAYAQGFDLLLFPAKLELAVAPGTSQDFVINARNLGADTQTMRVYFNDYFIKPNNDFVFQKPGHYSYSCATWLSTAPGDLVVPPGQTGSKTFTVTVPPKAEPGGHYGVIFFEQAPPPGNATITAKPRIGSLILVTVPGQIIRQGEIKSVSITSTWFWPAHKVPILPTRKVKARVVFYNSGNVHLTIRGSLTYKASLGWGSGKVEFNDITVLPKTTRYLETDIPDPPLVGSFKINATVQYGPSLDVFDTSKEITGSFSEVPLSLLMIFIAIIAAIAIPLTVRHGRKKAAEEAAEGKDETKKAARKRRKEKKEPDGSAEPSVKEAGEESAAEETGKPEGESREEAGDVEEEKTEEAADKADSDESAPDKAPEVEEDEGGKPEASDEKMTEEDQVAADEVEEDADQEGEEEPAATKEETVGEKRSRRWFKGRRK
jgi:hypothetical protein